MTSRPDNQKSPSNMPTGIAVVAHFAICAGLFMTAGIATAETKQFKVLELDQNEKGPYAIFSGGSADGLRKDDEVCVLKDASDEEAFCAKVVNIKSKAAAFYIPAGHQFEVMMGTLVTAEVDTNKEGAADENPDENSDASDSTDGNQPWFLSGGSIEVGYHAQITPAVKSSSMSFDPLPRADTNAPWKSRDAISMALAGVTGSYARNFRQDGHQLGVRGFYAQSIPAAFDNDYDLTDTISHVETNTSVNTLGLSIFYGIEKKSTEEITFRGSGGIGVRLSRLRMTGDLKAANNTTLADLTLTSTAPVIDFSGGASYNIWGMDWSANLLMGIPISVTTSSTGSFTEFQDVSESDIETNITDAAAIQKGLEIAVTLGVVYRH